jgi:phage FluMu protein Com
MGVYSEYLETLAGYSSIVAERKKQLQRIMDKRKRSILAIASDLSGRPDKANAPIGIDYTDLLAVADQIDSLSGEAVDVVLETPGGLAERAEDIVRMIRNKFESVAFIVPGAAMSAGTIMVMSGDEILLEPSSSLGPIDAQVFVAGKNFSAEAFLTGLEKIKEEVERTGSLNRAYIPILQGISPGEIQACQNAQDFSKKLVSAWLAKWKFRTWTTHVSSGKSVTEREKKQRAATVARQLCKHSHWLTHSRSIKLDDLRAMRLKITDYTQDPDLCDAIRRYHVLIRMGFEATNMYKLFETPTTQIQRFLATVIAAPTQADQAKVAHIDYACPRCAKITRIQANLGEKNPTQQGNVAFPADNKFRCPNCGLEADLSNLRKQIEAQSKKPVVF